MSSGSTRIHGLETTPRPSKLWPPLSTTTPETKTRHLVQSSTCGSKHNQPLHERHHDASRSADTTGEFQKP